MARLLNLFVVVALASMLALAGCGSSDTTSEGVPADQAKTTEVKKGIQAQGAEMTPAEGAAAGDQRVGQQATGN